MKRYKVTLVSDRTNRQQNLVLGCGLTSILLMVAILGIGGYLWQSERDAAHYPGAVRISSHSNYQSLPREIRWDDSYRTADPFPDVYNWYSNGFGLGPEARANSNCILIEGSQRQALIERYTGVMLCDTPTGRMIFVTRSASLAH